MTLRRLTNLLPVISSAELRTHLRSFNEEEDSLIKAYILAAQNDIELCCERALCVAKYRLVLPAFPGRSASPVYGGLPFDNPHDQRISTNGSAILLRMVPSVKVASITYFDGDNESATYEDYIYLQGEPTEVCQELDTTWPTTYRRRDAVTLDFWAGELVPLSVNLTTNVFTSLTGYPYEDGDEITFSCSGNSNSAMGDVATLPGGITEGTTYFVRDVSGSTFKVAATSGGAAIDLTAAATGYEIDLLFGGSLEPFHKLALFQMAAKAYGERCPQGGCVCSADEMQTNPLYRRMIWRSPVEFV